MSETVTRDVTLPELARLGFVEGRNLVFDGRVGGPEALPGLMRELLAAQPDAIVAIGPALVAASAATRAVAAGAGVELLVFNVAAPVDYPAAFAAMRAAGAQALMINATPVFYENAERLATLALEAGLPTLCEWAEMARAGCLPGYGPNRIALRQRIADQIARALNLDLPATIIARADEVIE